MKTLKIAIATVLAVAYIAVVGSTAYSQNLLAPKVENAYLNNEDEDSIFSRNSYDLPLRYASSSLLRNRGGASYGYQGVLNSAVNTAIARSVTPAYVDPWANYEKTLNLNYREVKYLYGKNNIPVSIVEIMPGGEESVICDILPSVELDYDGHISKGSFYLSYVDEDGFNVFIRLDNEPNWDNLLASASISDGVFYGAEAGGMITKSKSEYDLNGNRVLAVMKTWKFDKEGNISSVEVTKERSYYNGDGNLIRQSTYKEVDGKMVWIETKSRIYIGKTLFMETKTRLDYKDDGTIGVSTNEQSMFDGNGREIKYTLTAYAENRKTHTVTRQTHYGDNGSVTYYDLEDSWYYENGSSSAQYEHTTFNEETGDYYHSTKSVTYGTDGRINSYNCDVTEEKYNAAGQLVMKRHFYQSQTRPGWGPFAGQLTTTYESEDITENEYDVDGALIKEHLSGYWFSTSVDPWYDQITKFLYGMINNVKTLLGKEMYRIEATDKDFQKVTYTHKECINYEYAPDGCFGPKRLYSMSSDMREVKYDGNGLETYILEKQDTEYYDAAGKVVTKYHFYKEQTRPGWGPFAGQLVTTREEESKTEFVYDADGDLTSEHTAGYWFTTYVDPWYEKLVTYLYGLVADVKKLFNRHETYVESQNADFTKISQVYEKDETYTYTKIGDKILLTSATTIITDTRFDGSGNIASTKETRRSESYLYDASGNVINKSTTELVNGDLRFMELISYTYHANGQVASMTRHMEQNSEWGWSQWEDEVTQYNEQGNLLYKSLQDSQGRTYTEERTYAADGITLLSKDIVSHSPNSGKWIIYNENGGYIERAATFEHTDYELHERYRADGKIISREEKVSDNNPYWERWFLSSSGVYNEADMAAIREGCRIPYSYWGYSTSRLTTERWDYTEGGVLTHYEKEETVKSSGGGWDWYGNNTFRSTKVTRDYDPATGKLLKEEYSVKGDSDSPYMLLGYAGRDSVEYVAVLDQIWQKESRPLIPEKCDALIKDVTNFFFSHDVLKYYGAFEKKMSLDYSVAGQVGIKCTMNDGQGQTISAFFGTIEFDASGNITNMTFSYTGAWQEEWQGVLEGFQKYGPIYLLNIDKSIAQSELHAAETQSAETQCAETVKNTVVDDPEVLARLEIMDQKNAQMACPQGVTMTSEMARKDIAREEIRP